MTRRVELVFDNEIKSNKIIGNIQLIIGILVLLTSVGFLLGRGIGGVFALTLLTAIFMIVTALHTKRK